MKRLIVIFLFCQPFLTFSAGPSVYSYIKYSSNQESCFLQVYVSSADADINAIEGKLVLPPQADDLFSISTKGSPVSLWLKRPAIKNDRVEFEGIIPGGISGEHNILSLECAKPVESFSAPTVSLSLKTYLNDGEGTLVVAQDRGIITEDLVKATRGESTDKQPPEAFLPEIVSVEDLYDGKYVLLFQAQDKESGINRYEVMESNGTWKSAESPYLLEDQSVLGDVYVRAVDEAGNFIVVKAVGGGQDKGVFGINKLNSNKISSIVFGLIILFLLLLVMWIVHRRKKQ